MLIYHLKLKSTVSRKHLFLYFFPTIFVVNMAIIVIIIAHTYMYVASIPSFLNVNKHDFSAHFFPLKTVFSIFIHLRRSNFAQVLPNSHHFSLTTLCPVQHFCLLFTRFNYVYPLLGISFLPLFTKFFIFCCLSTFHNFFHFFILLGASIAPTSSQVLVTF